MSIEVLHLFVSSRHNYFGHHGLPAGQTPTTEVDTIECVAGRGLHGDRFFDYKENYKGLLRQQGFMICPWGGRTTVFPWIRFDLASYEGDAESPKLVMVFSGHEVTAEGVNLFGLVERIREQRITCLRALPPGYCTVACSPCATLARP